MGTRDARLRAKLDENYGMISESTRGALVRYIEDRIQPGDFWMAALSNNFVNAVARADDNNRENLQEIMFIIYNEIPGNAWGSPEIVAEWIGGEHVTS